MVSLLLPVIYLAFISLACRMSCWCGLAQHVPGLGAGLSWAGMISP